MGTRRLVVVLAVLIAFPVGVSAQPPRLPNAGRIGRLGEIGPPRVLTFIPSVAGGDRGIAVGVVPPLRARYASGAPVVIHVPGGVDTGATAGPLEYAGLGFVEIRLAFPGGGRGAGTSGGTYDYRGPHCLRALADVIRFATGRLADLQGRKIQDLLAKTVVLTQNVGLVGSSHGGNACGLVMATHGEEFPDLAFYASMESPYGEGNVNIELGGWDQGVNPAYDPQAGLLDLSKLAWSSDLAPGPPRRWQGLGAELTGSLFFDLNGDGRFSEPEDFPANVFVQDLGQGPRAWYSPRLVREAESRRLYGEQRPSHVPSVEDSTEYWRWRDAAGAIGNAVRKCPNVAVIVYANERDHVQAAPDHPHILIQVESLRQSGAKFVRLNPDRAYVERILASGSLPPGTQERSFPDNDAGRPWDRQNIRSGLEPAGVPVVVFMQAAVCELADRAIRQDWSQNLNAVLYLDAPWQVFGRPPGSQGQPRSPVLSRQRPRDGSLSVTRVGPNTTIVPSGSEDMSPGAKQIQVNAAAVIGRIRSLSGTNRGPLFYPREPGGQPGSLVDSYRWMGLDFIRTHDFYGPTDWHVIFPNWRADPNDPASYDFMSSDPRIRAIVEGGFQCFFRLGTSWKGSRREPINDPPGTLRDAQGRVTHVADQADFRKWAKTCVQTIRHYTEGWKDGFRFPIAYWEIWNEPDLAAQFWTGTPEQYYVMYEEASRAIKAMNPLLKVGGPACTGALREAYVEGFIRYCREHDVPLDFFSWHSYGGRDDFNPYQYHQDAMRIRRALDQAGFAHSENILTEWNAGIQQRLFNDTPAGVAFYASTLASLLDAGVDRAFQYCGDRHPGLGLHDLRTGEPKICGDAFVAWKQLLETPERLQVDGSDDRGYNVVAGKSTDSRRLHVLISDYQSPYTAFRLRLTGLPWPSDSPVRLRRWLVGPEHRWRLVEDTTEDFREAVVDRPFQSGSVCLLALEPRI